MYKKSWYLCTVMMGMLGICDKAHKLVKILKADFPKICLLKYVKQNLKFIDIY